MAIDHPDMPDLYGCHYVTHPHQACEEAAREWRIAHPYVGD